MINVYDFDKTIYKGDSSIDFYLYCLKKNKKILLCLPKQFCSFVLYKFRLKNKLYFKENFFCFLNYIDNVDEFVKEFWEVNYKKIKKWYLIQKKNTDVIISASPDFLLSPLKNKLNICDIIASKVSMQGNFISKNCYGNEKVVRYKEKHTEVINNFYSDSKSDFPMALISKNAFIVNNNKIKKWEFKK